MINETLIVMATLAVAISGIMQILRMRKTGSARDVSFGFAFLVVFGVFLSLILVIINQSNWSVILERTIGFLVTLVVLIYVIYYKLKDRKV